MNEPIVRPFDFRLVPAAVVGWTATLAGILAGTTVVGVLTLGWALLAIVCCGIRVRLGKWGFGVIALAVIGCCYSGASAAHSWAFEVSPVGPAAIAKAWVSAEVVVSEDPRTVRFGGPATVAVRAKLIRIDIGGTHFTLGGRVTILAPADGWDHVVPGQRLIVRGKLAPPDRRDLTVAELRVHGPPLVERDLGTVPAIASDIRTSLATAAAQALPPEQAGLLPGLVVGDVSALPEDLETDFRAAGLAHLNAVSGANFAIVLGAVLLLTRAIGLGPRTTTVICAAVLVAFVVVARPSPSVLRAAVMGAIGLLALVTGRRRQAVPALCTAVLGLLAWWPELAVDFGFALSVSATAGLVVLAPVWADWLRKHGWGRASAEILAVAAAAHTVTAPIVAGMAGTFSVVGIVANIVVAPVVAPITVVGAIAAVISPWAPGIASLVLKLASAPLWWLITVARWAASVPGARVATPTGWVGVLVVLAVTAGLLVSLRSRTVRRILGSISAAVVLVWSGFSLLYD